MSTKIYTGFKLKTTDMAEIHERISQIRKLVEEDTNQKIASNMAAECASLYDKRTMDASLDRTISVYQAVFGEIARRQMEVKQRQVKDPTVDFSMSVTLFPFEGEFYGMLYTVQPEYGMLWFKQEDFVEPFMYWNNTDPAEDCTEEEWRERERVWEAIFAEQPVPALNGFTYEIALDYNLFTPSAIELEKFIPALSDRAISWAKDKVYHDFTSNRKITQENVMKVLRKFKEYCESDVGKQALMVAEDEAMKNLRLTITAVQLAEKA
jgi:hypothetical protein